MFVDLFYSNYIHKNVVFEQCVKSCFISKYAYRVCQFEVCLHSCFVRSMLVRLLFCSKYVGKVVVLFEVCW